MPSVNKSMKVKQRSTIIQILLITANLGLIGVWLCFTPAGLEAKLNTIGYAVCHQIASHSLFYGAHQLPLCARCTGLFLGTLLGSIILLRKGRCGQLPSRKFVFLLAIPVIGFLVDGLNSTLFFFDGWKGMYPPSNTLRLFTGLGMGLVLANVLIPLWNQILWTNWSDQPLLNKGILGIQVLAILLSGWIINLELPWLYLPMAILSSLTVVGLLAAVYTLIWTLGLKKDNTFTNLKQAGTYLLLGLLTAGIHLEGMALLRFALTQTWTGFSL